MNTLKALSLTFFGFVAAYILFELLFMNQKLSYIVTNAILAGLGFCCFTYVAKPLFKKKQQH